MSCLLPLIAGACLFEPSALTLTLVTSTQVGGNVHHVDHQHDYRGGRLGRATLQAGGHLTSQVQLIYGIAHESLLDTGKDRGEERFYAGITWQPFR